MESFPSLQRPHLGLVLQNLEMCPNHKHLLYEWKKHVFGKTSNILLKIDTDKIILIEDSFNSMMRYIYNIPKSSP